ncbi:hypothetical protein OAC06_07590 [Alphaproteobacteria bacterium]|nr:hypothetical protein [Alphaproteobacteria bacterium]
MLNRFHIAHMRKLLLVLFLLSLTSNALAKVENWKCDVFGVGDTILKIDTSIPMIYLRKMGKWTPFYPEPTTSVYKYSKEHDSIYGYMPMTCGTCNGAGKVSSSQGFFMEDEGKRINTWDLILKEFIIQPESVTLISTYSCRVMK